MKHLQRQRWIDALDNALENTLMLDSPVTITSREEYLEEAKRRYDLYELRYYIYQQEASDEPETVSDD